MPIGILALLALWHYGILSEIQDCNSFQNISLFNQSSYKNAIRDNNGLRRPQLFLKCCIFVDSI